MYLMVMRMPSRTARLEKWDAQGIRCFTKCLNLKIISSADRDPHFPYLCHDTELIAFELHHHISFAYTVPTGSPTSFHYGYISSNFLIE